MVQLRDFHLLSLVHTVQLIELADKFVSSSGVDPIPPPIPLVLVPSPAMVWQCSRGEAGAISKKGDLRRAVCTTTPAMGVVAVKFGGSLG